MAQRTKEKESALLRVLFRNINTAIQQHFKKSWLSMELCSYQKLRLVIGDEGI